VTSYENVSNEIWRVTRSSRVTDSVTNSLVTAMDQLTGLGSGIIARSVSIANNSGEVTATETSFDPATHVRTVTSSTDSRTPNVQTSKYGYTLTSSGLDGSLSVTYNGLAREVGRASRDVSNNLLSTSTVSYDNSGNVTTNAITYGQASTPDVMTITSYNNFGRPITTATFTYGQAVSVTTNAYDVTGALIAQGGDTYPVAFASDTSERRTQLTTRYGEADASASTQWKYSQSTGLLTNKLDAAGTGAAYTYTSDGKPLRTTWARGSWKENAYNSRGLVSTSSYSDDSMDVSYAFNAAGLLSLASNAAGFATAYAFSDALVLTNETVSGLDAPGSIFEIGRTVDSRQRPSAMSLAHNGTNITLVSYGYDTENRLSTIDQVDAGVEYAYNGNYMTGCTIALTNGAVFTRTFVRDPYRKHLVNALSNSFDGVSVYSAAYAHDLLSRRTNIVMTAQSGTNVLSCAYNPRSEVTGATIDTNDYAYIYDNIGNSLFTSINAVTNAYTVNALNQYTDISYPVNPVNPVYDLDGNMLTNGVWSFTYDAENRMIDAYSNDTLLASNTYDHLSRRIRKAVSSSDHSFIWDGWNLIHETITNTNGTCNSIEYVWALDLSGTRQGAGGVGGLLFEKHNGAIYIPCYDANGNITTYVDENGSMVAYRQFDAFGNTIAKGGAMVDVFHFWYSTKYLDHDTGLYYYGYRYYSPMLQRWINRDPIEERGGVNPYGFVGNEPVNSWDRLGLFTIHPTSDSPRHTMLSDGVSLDQLWASAFIRFSDFEKKGLSRSGGVLLHTKSISVDLVTSNGKRLSESQTIERGLRINSDAFVDYRQYDNNTAWGAAWPTAPDGVKNIYYNIATLKAATKFGKKLRGTIKIQASWGLYFDRMLLPPHGDPVDDTLSGSLDTTHGGMDNPYIPGSFVPQNGAIIGSGAFTIIVTLSCDKEPSIRATISPLGYSVDRFKRDDWGQGYGWPTEFE
jgi:RHS repeat-associated protein